MSEQGPLHPFIQRQLRRHFGGQEPAGGLAPVLRAVSELLRDVDRERDLNAAAMDALSRELEERYERIEQSEKRYRAMFDESPLAVFAIDASDRSVRAWNKQAERLFGWTADEVLGRNIDALDLRGPGSLEMPALVGLGAALPPEGVTTELPMFTRDGRRLEIELTIHSVALDGQMVFLSHARDRTAERESQRAQAETEARFRAFFDYAGIAIHVLSFEGEILEANPASQALLGWLPEDIIGRPATSLSPEEDVESTRDLAVELRAGARDAVTVERRFFHKEGHLVWGQLTVSRVSIGASTRLIGMIQDISERKRMESQLVKQAFQDELTGLANRVLFRDRLRHALERRSRGGTHVAVILLDLDGFKRVNDSLGHAVGDELLQIVGRRIASTVRAGETVARLGGDEFAVVIEVVEQGDDPRMLAERLLTLLRMPMRIRGREVVVGVSIGIAIAEPEEDEESVLRNADVAMYAAKTSGRACVKQFDRSMHVEAMAWLELESDLRLAIDRREFLLEFQPLMQIATGQVQGFEALVRWEHPTKGLINPTQFLTIAEETGMIVSIGRWVMQEACIQAARWNRLGLEAMSISVNVAARQLDGEALVDDVRTALQISGLDPRRLVLEITESDVMSDLDEALRKLNALKTLGVRLAIDDFGTGYSSLSQLQFFPVDELKIDRSFVSRIEQGDREAAFVRTIVSLAKSLSMEVVAEGVESDEQQQFLHSIGCDLGQGYLYSRPIGASEVERFVDDARQVRPLFPSNAPRRLA
ncbi:MAG: EAL domain-containing protein [Gemmatimonadaceae bacterium]|nr:EAL domain-containing protein [Gemmatimonadaceae bacterium]